MVSICLTKVATVQRRNTLAGPSIFSGLNPELELGEISEKPEKSRPNEEPSSDVTSPRLILKNSWLRLANSIIPQIEAEVQAGFRVVWVLIYFGLFGVFMFTFYDLVDKYTKYPTTFDLTVETDARLDFPGGTVCNENPVKKSYMKYFVDVSDILILDNYVRNFLNFYEPDDKSGKISEADFFVCEDKRNCIPHQWICDGKIQCDDGSDEKMDNERCIDANRWRIENNGSSHFCVSPFIKCLSAYGYLEFTCAKPCDEVVECVNAVDEINQSFTCPLTYKSCELLYAEPNPKTISFPVSGGDGCNMRPIPGGESLKQMTRRLSELL
ncbi:uncharacterized protein LOC142354041 isoform X2 [Convolutriloba macropyga]|uniref:uncharacterized protein LOC142354041 isoform X2 n=1 Tax=Convolutriloba macropyga TaxID=536237 RepID=UPI003F51B47B